MFYCDPCAKKNNWPDSIGKSVGPCEICGKTAECNDRPSSTLPSAEPDLCPICGEPSHGPDCR